MKPIRWLRRGLTWGSMGLAGGALIVTARHILSTPQPLESTLPGEGRIDRRREGDIYYNVAGAEGASPIVLLHGFYSGASNYEFRRIFPRLAVDYRVYAPDWLGFGMSERPALAYTGEFYANLLTGFLRETVGRPATVIAHGLAANITVRAASDAPELVERLVLVSPRALAGTAPAPNLAQSLVRTAQRSSLGMVPYAALATRSALRWQLNRRASHPGEGGATDDALDHVYASSHQFGGQHALLALITGELDLPIQNAFAMLEQPVLVVAGELDHVQTRQAIEDLAELNPSSQLDFILNAGDAVHEDQPAAFVERVNTWFLTPHTAQRPETLASATMTAAAARPPAIGTQAPPMTGAAPTVSGEPGALLSGGIFSAPDAESVPPTSPVEGVAATAATGLTERFGEPRGMVTPTPGLEGLEGLAEQAPESIPVEQTETPTTPVATQAAVGGQEEAHAEPLDVAGTVSEAEAAPVAKQATAAAQTIGKPEGELDEVAAPASAAAATEQTAQTLAQIEERVAAEAQRVESAIQAGAPGSATDAATTQAEVTDGAAPESAAAQAPDTEEMPAPERSRRMDGRDGAPRTQPRPASEGQAGERTRATDAAGASTSSNRRNRSGKGGRGAPYAAAASGEDQPDTGHHETRGSSGRKHSGHKRKNAPR